MVIEDFNGLRATIELVREKPNPIIMRLLTDSMPELILNQITHTIPEGFSWRWTAATKGNERLDLSVYFVLGDFETLGIRFRFDCRDREIMDEVARAVITIWRRTTRTTYTYWD